MTPATLQALRRLLLFSVEEAATMIGGVSPRSWQYWERGERPVPPDVAGTMEELCAWRLKAIASSDWTMAEHQKKHGYDAKIALVWYQTLDDWLTINDREPQYWRPQCSVVAELAARRGANLVTFDGPAYAAWLGNRKDGEQLRAAWAAAIL